MTNTSTPFDFAKGKSLSTSDKSLMTNEKRPMTTLEGYNKCRLSSKI